MNTDALESLGLTPGEAKVYLALLETGPSSAGKIIDRARLQNSVIHFCLNKLIELGLVSYIKKGNSRVYTAADPKEFLAMLEERKKAFENVLPELELKQKLSKAQQTAEMFEGVKGVTTMLHQLIADVKKGDEFLFFTTDVPEYNEEIQNFYRNYDLKRKTKGLVVKGLAPTRMKKLFENRPVLKMKYADFPIPANIGICNDKLVMLTWEEKPTGLLVQSKQLAYKQRTFFYSLWDKL